MVGFHQAIGIELSVNLKWRKYPNELFSTPLFGDQIGYLLIGETTMECGLRPLSGALSSHEEPEVIRILKDVPASDFRPHPT